MYGSLNELDFYAVAGKIFTFGYEQRHKIVQLLSAITFVSAVTVLNTG